MSYAPYSPPAAEAIAAVYSRIKAKMPSTAFARIEQPPVMHESGRELFRDACAMKRAVISAEDQETVLRWRFRDYYRPVEDREFENAIAHANDAPSTGRRWPKANPELWANLTSNSAGSLERLKGMSPVKLPGTLSSGEIINRLFGPNDLLCLGTSAHRATTERRGYFLGDEAEYPLIVPNAMSAEWGKTQSGRDSQRCLGNVGPRQHAVIEFDHGSLDDQAAILMHIQSLGVFLRCVVFSGSKSLHGWFDVRTAAHEEVEKLLRYAAACGADVATFVAVQFVRTPNAMRDEERLQETLYLS